MYRMMKLVSMALAVAGACGALATADVMEVEYLCAGIGEEPCYSEGKCGGQINISGATLFLSFFEAPASTNQYNDVNCNGTPLPPIEQLAPNFAPAGQNWSGWWLVQYRGVGSGNGLAEFVASQCDGDVPQEPPTDKGLINRFVYSVGGVNQNPYGCDMYPDPCCDAHTPVCPEQIDVAVMDVPTTWFVEAGDVADAGFGVTPGTSGYGRNPTQSWDTNYKNTLKDLGCLNTRIEDPDAYTVYDTSIAWVPIAIIANRGTGIGIADDRGEGNITRDELRHLFISGRLPNGENLVAATRDSGSGTRNGCMNSLGLDPSWGRGDNLASKSKVSTTDPLGPLHQATNKGGSSRMEAGVQNRRLAVGYTGLIGSSRAAADAAAGKYEILNVAFHGTNYARPSLDGILDNGDAGENAWQVGGPETFATVGDPTGINGPLMVNDDAADYINNITDSIAAFIDVPGGPDTDFTPGEYLATQYVLLASTDAVPNPLDPGNFIPNPAFNQSVQDYIRNHNPLDVPDFGGYFGDSNNRAPTRAADPDWPEGSVHIDGQYDDGSTGGQYLNRHTVSYSIGGGTDLNDRNRISGDFNNDGQRDINDIPDMMAAFNDPTGFTLANSSESDPIVVEIIGDFDGDGNFDAVDIRYFADGLAIDPTSARLDRVAAFLAIDLAWQSLTDDDNFFGTQIVDCAGETIDYVAGFSVYDVAGNTPWPGAAPHGFDGLVSCDDVAYIYTNFGDWSDLNDAVRMDLSCDVNSDLTVDCSDADAVIAALGGCTCQITTPPQTCAGDMDNDGDVDFDDIDWFVTALSGPCAYYTAQPGGNWLNADVNGNGSVDFDDIDPFVEVIGTTCE